VTEITTEITTEATTAPDRPSFPDILLHVIVTLLAPLFLVESGGDIQCARMAALETVNACRASDPADLIAVAQVIACGLAALDSLRRSMADDISLAMLLRLRGNAVALSRSADQNRRVLREGRTESAMPPQAAAPGEPEPEAWTSTSRPSAAALSDLPQAEAPSPVPFPAAVAARASTTSLSAAERQRAERQAAWGSAAATVAAEYAARLPHLPPAERKMATVRAAALSSAASDLLAGGVIPPRLRPGDLDGLRPNPA
jgi:hypothetical protein